MNDTGSTISYIRFSLKIPESDFQIIYEHNSLLFAYSRMKNDKESFAC
jgi:hypothetical protein